MSYLTTYPSTSEKYVTSSFGERWLNGVKDFHYGVDLRAREGVAILAAASGVVRESSYHSSYGNYIVLEHGSGQSAFCTLYAHLSSRSVGIGVVVNSGNVIGYAGNTGQSTAAHLHFELINAPYSVWNGNFSVKRKYNVDPYPYLVNLTGSLDGASAADNYQTGTYEDPLGKYQEYWNEIAKAADEQVQIIRDEGGKPIEKIGEKFFGRKCSILVSDENNEFELDVSGLYVEFSCEKKLFSEWTPAEITIYNLNASTENQIIDKAKKVKIMAGYNNIFGTIYEGVIIQCIRYKASATDFCLKILALDQMLIGYLGLNEKAFTAIANVTGTTKRQVLDSITNEQGITYQIKGGYDQVELDKPYIRGKVIFETTSNAMSSLTNSDGSYSYIDNGVVVYDNPEVQPLEGEIVTLDHTSGLLGIPSQSGYKVTIECLINPRIKLNSLIHVDNRLITQATWNYGNEAYRFDVDGIYRVIEISYSGVTRGNDWNCVIQAVSQQGIQSVFTATDLSNLLGE